MALFGKSICYLSVGLYIWKNDTATSKSSIPAGFFKLNRLWSLVQRKLCILGKYNLPHTDKNCTKLFMENIMKYFTHAQTVCTRPLLRGGGGPGAKAICIIDISI